MKIAIFSAKNYERKFLLAEAKPERYTLRFISERLSEETVDLMQGCEVVCCFVTDDLNCAVLQRLKKMGVRLVALRSAGYDHVDIQAARSLGLNVVRVPAYSPHAIAEFSVGLLLALSRKITLAHDRVRQHNFSLEGQVGFNLYGKTVGIIGAGNIGSIFIKIMASFGCNLLVCDPFPNEDCKKQGAVYVNLETVLKQSDVISLHCLLNQETKHLINQSTISLMKKDALLINTSRGGLIDTGAMIDALENRHLGGVGLDVYEHERALFFVDRSQESIIDKVFLRLQSFPNVIVTGHQAYLSQEALENIAKITLKNIMSFEEGILQNTV